MDSQYLYAMLLLFLFYVYIFVNHNSIIQICIACTCVFVFFKLQGTFPLDQFTPKRDGCSSLKSLCDRLHTVPKYKWICLDDQLLQFILDIEPIYFYDKQIVVDIIEDINNFCRVYFKALQKENGNMYRDLLADRRMIGRLLDLKKDVLESLEGVVYVVDVNVFRRKINVPQKINHVDSILTDKITLLIHKFNLDSSVIKSM